MDIQQLRCFAAVARYGKIQEAADALFVSRQAVSKTLSQMEDELGQPLFVRTHNGIAPNELGLRFVERADALVREFDALRAEMRKTDEICTVRICLPFTTHHYFWNLLDGFLTGQQDYLRVEPINCLEIQCHTLFESGALDMAVSILPFGSGIDEGRLVATSPIVIAVNEKNPVCRKTSLTREDLAQLPLIYYMNGYEEPFWLEKNYPKPEYAVNDILQAFDLVIRDKGVFPVPELSMLRPMQGIVCLPYRGPDDCDHFYCAISDQAGRDKRKRRACLALRDALAGGEGKNN